jgi:prepilin-type N-terminal cleavage/methylation domain-containing protein
MSLKTDERTQALIRRGRAAARAELVRPSRYLGRLAPDAGFSLVELFCAMTILVVIAGMALPGVMTSVQAYRLHSDAATIAGAINVARMRAASQYTPYRLNVATGSGTYSIEKLCGNTPVSSDASCTGFYSSFSTPVLETGTQYVSQGTLLAACRPAGASSYPGTITADPSACGSPVQFYFNTRGSPVDATGNPLANGGSVIYLRNTQNALDAVALSIGGRAAAYNWDVSGNSWYRR